MEYYKWRALISGVWGGESSRRWGGVVWDGREQSCLEERALPRLLAPLAVCEGMSGSLLTHLLDAFVGLGRAFEVFLGTNLPGNRVPLR